MARLGKYAVRQRDAVSGIVPGPAPGVARPPPGSCPGSRRYPCRAGPRRTAATDTMMNNRQPVNYTPATPSTPAKTPALNPHRCACPRAAGAIGPRCAERPRPPPSPATCRGEACLARMPSRQTRSPQKMYRTPFHYPLIRFAVLQVGLFAKYCLNVTPEFQQVKRAVCTTDVSWAIYKTLLCMMLWCIGSSS